MKNKTKPGFTLLELLVVIVIIGIMTGVLIPVLYTYIKNAQITRANENAHAIFSAAQTYTLRHNKLDENIADGVITYQVKFTDSGYREDTTVTDYIIDGFGDDTDCVFAVSIKDDTVLGVVYAKSASSNVIGSFPNEIDDKVTSFSSDCVDYITNNYPFK